MSETIPARLNFDEIPHQDKDGSPLPNEVPVTYQERTYVLVEATGEVAAKYQNAIFRSSRLDDGKLIGMDGLADASLILVSGCLFPVKDGVRGPNVTLPTIKSWPNRIVKKLFETARDISDLADQDTVEGLEKQITNLQKRLNTLREKNKTPEEISAGKEQSAGTDGSA